MSKPKYQWRRLTPEQREEVLTRRQEHGCPWHAPPHRPNYGYKRFHITAACFEHRPYIGLCPERMDAFACDLLDVLATQAPQTFAWCVLPNHYHALVEAPDILGLLAALGRLHGRTSYTWNCQEEALGRQVFFRAADRAMRSERHYWATLNYVHHNPVRHGYVTRWPEWPWSSAAEYLAKVGVEAAEQVWRAYPLDDYGKGWDEPDM